MEAFERETLLAELKRNHHHMTNTAKALGLERSHLYKKCQQLGIDLRAVRQMELAEYLCYGTLSEAVAEPT